MLKIVEILKSSVIVMSGQALVQKRFDVLYDDVKQFFKNTSTGRLSVASVTALTRYSMEVVQTGENWTGMKGSEKKDLVYGVVTEVIKDLLHDPEVVGEDFDEGTRDAILAALNLVPLVIDAAVDFAKTYSSARPSGEGDSDVVHRRKCFGFC